MARLIITAYADGQVLRTSDTDPNISSLMVKDDSVQLQNGFVMKNNRPAFIRGNTEALKALKFKVGDDISTVFGPQRMVTKESTKSFYPGQKAKINPKTGEIITSGGQPIYSATELVAENSTAYNEFIKADTSDVTTTQAVGHDALKN